MNSNQQELLPLIEALRIAAGDIVYLASDRGQLDRFKGTLEQIAAAIEPYQFWDTEARIPTPQPKLAQPQQPE